MSIMARAFPASTPAPLNCMNAPVPMPRRRVDRMLVSWLMLSNAPVAADSSSPNTCWYSEISASMSALAWIAFLPKSISLPAARSMPCATIVPTATAFALTVFARPIKLCLLLCTPFS